jgi:hypothetical protein
VGWGASFHRKMEKRQGKSKFYKMQKMPSKNKEPQTVTQYGSNNQRELCFMQQSQHQQDIASAKRRDLCSFLCWVHTITECI